MPYRPSRAAIAVLTGALCLASGCDRRPNKAELQARLDRAEQLCLDTHYDNARAVLKAYLLDDPENAGAHFYLGRTYLVTDPLVAEGEYQTALRLFTRQGRVSPTKRLSPDYFELMCNLDSAKALMLRATAGLSSTGEQRSDIRDTIARAFTYIARAKEINPKADEINVVAAPLHQLAKALGIDQV